MLLLNWSSQLKMQSKKKCNYGMLSVINLKAGEK